MSDFGDLLLDLTYHVTCSRRGTDDLIPDVVELFADLTLPPEAPSV